MAIELFRVDERLIHGQVVVGWGERLATDRIVVVDDQLSASEWEQELYRLGVPPTVTALFVPVEEARRSLPSWRSSPQRTIVLLRDVATLQRLARDGALAGEDVNLGGIHFAPGRVRVLPFLFLSPGERADLRQIAAGGVRIHARDLPSSRRVPLSELPGDD